MTALGIFLIAFIPRAWALDVFMTYDELRWVNRSMDFFSALLSRNWAGTLRAGHPGVTTMLCGSLGAAIQDISWRIGISSPAPAGWSAGDLINVARLIPTTTAESLTALRFPVALVTSIGVVGLYLVSHRLFDRRVALLGSVLIALEPFFLAHSRFLHTDALLSTFAALSIVSLAAWLGEDRWRFLILSGSAAGLALLTKSPAAFLLPAILLTVLIRFRKDLKRAIPPLALWGFIMGATAFALWPAMWVNPIGTIVNTWRNAMFARGAGHVMYFLGNISMDPGPGFYPLALLSRATPLTLLGVALTAIQVVLGRHHGERRTIGFLLAYVLGFALFVSTSDKKQDRYLLPIFPVLDLLAAVGWVRALEWALEQATRRAQWKWPIAKVAPAYLGLGIVLALQAASSLPTAPYYLTYYSPAVGGTKGAKELIQVGWGEGMNLAAAYLNSLPGSAHQRVAASYSESFQPFFHGETLRLTPRTRPSDPAPTLVEADHVVLYLSDVQRNRPAVWAVSLLKGQEPEHVVRLGGIDYAWIYRGGNLPIYTDPPAVQYPVEVPLLDRNSERKITLLGYDLDADSVPSGGSVTVDLYWRCDQPPGAYLNLSLQPVNAILRPWGGSDEAPMGDHPPTLFWVEGLILRDRHTIHILPGTPPGSYRLLTELYDPYGVGSLHPPEGEPLFLKAIEVIANPNLSQSNLGIHHLSNLRLGEGIHLLGYNLEDAIQPGGTLHLTLFWEALEDVAQDYTVFTHVIDGANNVLGQHDGQPADGFSPTSKWAPGIPIRDPHDLVLSTDIPPGSYQIEVGLYLPDTGERLPVLDEGGTSLGDRILLAPIQVETP